MPEISVIIAAYNVEKYIQQCVESVCRQTMEDIEIIVCDDCSTDNTLDIVKALAEKDSRIRIVPHAKNAGTMLNRKDGIKIAGGKYIMFLDGDDYYSADACGKAYRAITAENTDILQFGTSSFAEKEGYEDVVDGVTEYFKFPEEKITVPAEGGLLDITRVPAMNYNLTTKIYRAGIVHSMCDNLPEDRINLREDLLQVYLLLFFAKSYSFINDKLYHYRVGVGISTDKSITDAKLEARAKSYYVYTWLKEWTAAMGAADRCAKRLEEIKMQMLDNVAAIILDKFPKNKRQWYVDTVLKYCPKEEFIAYMSYLVYGTKRYREEELSKIIKSVSLFRAKPEKVKTIGTFYHRIRNGGVEKVISLLSDIWDKEGYKVVVFTDEEANKDDYPLNENAVRVVLPVIRGYTYKEYLDRTKAWLQATESCNIDIMIYHAWLNINKVADIAAVKSAGIPFITHTHGLFCSSLEGNDFNYAYRASNLSYIYQCVDGVIALTDVDAAWWQSKGLRCYKTTNPIELTPDIPPSELGGKNVIVSARIDRSQKQTDQAIEVARLVSEKMPDVRFTFIGGCDDKYYLAEIQKMIKDYGLQNNVDMAGYVQNVTDYYQKADVMLSTSRFEGFSLALTEGKVCGLPLVCYFLANWDMARNPKGMINIPQGDIHAAADAIISILTDDEYKKELGRQARESGLEYLNTDIGKIWNEIFEDMYQNEFHYEDDISIKEPLAAATDILALFNAKGLETRGISSGFSSQDVIYYQIQCNALDRTIKEIRNSTAYKVGMLITYIPRKLKSIFRK